MIYLKDLYFLTMKIYSLQNLTCFKMNKYHVKYLTNYFVIYYFDKNGNYEPLIEIHNFSSYIIKEHPKFKLILELENELKIYERKFKIEKILKNEKI